MSSYTRRTFIHGFAKLRELHRDVNLFVDKRLFKLAAVKQKELIQALKMSKREFKAELVDLIVILLQGARPDEALEVVEDLLKMDPNLREFLPVKAILLHSMRRTNDAKKLQETLKNRKDIPSVSMALLDRALEMPAGLEVVQVVLLEDKRSNFNTARVPANYEAPYIVKEDKKPDFAESIPEAKPQQQQSVAEENKVSKPADGSGPQEKPKSATVQNVPPSSITKQNKQKIPPAATPAKKVKQSNAKPTPSHSKGQNHNHVKKSSSIPAYLLPKPHKHTSLFAVLEGVDSDGEDRSITSVMPHDDQMWPELQKSNPQPNKSSSKKKKAQKTSNSNKQKHLVGGLKVRSWDETDHSDETSSTTPSLPDSSEVDSMSSNHQGECDTGIADVTKEEESTSSPLSPNSSSVESLHNVNPTPGFDKLRKILAEAAQKRPTQCSAQMQEEADAITAAAAHWKLQAMESQEKLQMIQVELENFSSMIDTLRIEYSAKIAATQAACDLQLREERSKVSKLKIGYNFVMSVVKDQAEGLVPEEFFCPISLELMSDPVMTTSGQSYERSAIETLLKNRHEDPLTRKACTIADLRTNHALAAAIKTWKRQREALAVAKQAAEMYTSLGVASMMDFNFHELEDHSTAGADDISAPLAPTSISMSSASHSGAAIPQVRSQSRMAKRFGSSYDESAASSTSE